MAKFTLPEMPYKYDALEPHIDAETMEIHHTKHHQKYTDELNAALEKVSGDIANKNIEEILSNISQIPEDVREPIDFNGGGYDNHKLFWHNMKPNGGGEPGGAVADAINKTFGSFNDFKDAFSKKTAGIRGSGWGWLVFNPQSQNVEYKAMPNQTSPRTLGLIPLLGLDIWEHAFYLKYRNRKPDYIAAWWNVVNWDEVENRLSKAKG